MVIRYSEKAVELIRSMFKCVWRTAGVERERQGEDRWKWWPNTGL